MSELLRFYNIPKGRKFIGRARRGKKGYSPSGKRFLSHLFYEKSFLKFSQELDKISFSDPCCKVLPNAFAQYALSAEEIRKALRMQMDHPVLWEDSMRRLLSDGIDLFIEVGPGKVLKGLETPERLILKERNLFPVNNRNNCFFFHFLGLGHIFGNRDIDI